LNFIHIYNLKTNLKVGDIHRTLLLGGIFGYPANNKYPEGKLRLVYETAPLAFLIEQVYNTINNYDFFFFLQYYTLANTYIIVYLYFFVWKKAGGKASNGHTRILDIKPSSIYQRSPIFLGSIDDVNEVEKYSKSKDWKIVIYCSH
jgi:fructose-1,6-bisphosphatase I